MNHLFSVLGETAIVVIIYFAIYYLFMRNERFFMLNRMFLLFSMLFAIVYPFLRITIPVESQTAIPTMMQEGYILPDFEVTAGSPSRISIDTLLKIIYFAGVVIFLTLLLIKLIRVILLIIRSEKTKIDDYYLIKSDETSSPFSFFNYIIIPDNQYNDSEIISIILHERNHIRQHHSIDLIISEIFKALQWFNPVSWLYNRELQYIHEYIADKSVIISGINQNEYLSLLIFNTNECRPNGICNNFNILLTKKRIKMIMNTNKKSGAWLKVLPAIALTICLLAAHTSCTQQDAKQNEQMTATATFNPSSDITYIVDGKEVKDPSAIPDASDESVVTITLYKDKKEVQQIAEKYGITAKNALIEVTTKAGVATPSKVSLLPISKILPDMSFDYQSSVGTTKDEPIGQVFDVVEEQPEFPGGNTALMKYLNDNINYPEDAQTNGIKGRVTVKFIVRDDGRITNILILKGIDPSLDKESVRVVQGMPKWKPGKQNGKPVNVWYTLPITYQLN